MKIIDNRVNGNIRDLKIGDVIAYKNKDYYMVIEDSDGLYAQDGYFDYLLIDLKHGTIQTFNYSQLKDFRLVEAELHIE